MTNTAYDFSSVDWMMWLTNNRSRLLFFVGSANIIGFHCKNTNKNTAYFLSHKVFFLRQSFYAIIPKIRIISCKERFLPNASVAYETQFWQHSSENLLLQQLNFACHKEQKICVVLNSANSYAKDRSRL